MTCIVGIVHNGEVYIGGDSAGTSGWDRTIVLAPKVFRVGEFLIGHTADCRMGQLLQYQLSVKEQDGEGDRAYMITVFAEAVRGLLKEFGYATVDNNAERGGVFLVGYHGHLYMADVNFAVVERADGFDAVGCGDSFALGALAVNGDKPPRERVVEALTVSAHFSIAVSAPFHVEVLL